MSSARFYNNYLRAEWVTALAAKRASPHVLPHPNAMLLQARHIDIATIALCLSHESIKTTYLYEHAGNAL